MGNDFFRAFIPDFLSLFPTYTSYLYLLSLVFLTHICSFNVYVICIASILKAVC
jgi:hypothetical protein